MQACVRCLISLLRAYPHSRPRAPILPTVREGKERGIRNDIQYRMTKIRELRYSSASDACVPRQLAMPALA